MVQFQSLACGALVASVASAYVVSRQAAQSVHDAFTAHGKLYFGTIAEKALLQIPQNEAIIAADFGALTCENSMKWATTERMCLRFSSHLPRLTPASLQGELYL
jgi:endo-1,4-beta-xylanase